MTEYYPPKCNRKDKLVKSRCECKKYTKKTIKIKAVKKPKRKLKITVKKISKKIKNKTRKKDRKKIYPKRKRSTKKEKKVTRCPNGTKRDPKTKKCIPKDQKPPMSRNKKKSTVIKNNTPKIAKELKKAQKRGKVMYSPSINKQLMTLKSITPRGDIFDCPDGGVLARTTKGRKCYGWKTKRARETMLANLNTTRPVNAEFIIAPAQHQSNCWMNSFFVAWFISDGGRKFNRWFRQTCITGLLPNGDSIPNKFKKPAFLLNKMIDASLRSKYEGDIARYAELMDTNDIIRQFHRAAPRTELEKTKKASNPLIFYEIIYRKMVNIPNMGSVLQGKWGDISIIKGPLGWLNIYLWSSTPPSVKKVEKLIEEAANSQKFIPNVLFVEIQDNASKKFKPPKKLSYKDENGKQYKYKLDGAVLRDIKQIHFSAYITINGKDYGFDGEGYSRLEQFDWKNKLNKNTKWRFAEQYETYFNFTKGYQMLIYYREK